MKANISVKRIIDTFADIKYFCIYGNKRKYKRDKRPYRGFEEVSLTSINDSRL